MKIASLAALALTLSGCQSLIRSSISSEVRATLVEFAPPGTEVTKLSEDLYTYRWGAYRSAFLTTPDGVILFDPLNTQAAAEMAAAIAKVAPNPTIKYVIYSHHHADHAGGAGVLPGKPIIVAHANAARDIGRWEHEGVVPPTDVWSGEEKEITLGGKTIKLLHLAPCHTDGMVAISIPQDRALYVVDLIVPKSIPPLGAPYSSFNGDLEVIDGLLKLDFDTLIPGHGIVGTKADAQNYLAFLRDLRAAARASAKKYGFVAHGDLSTYADPKLGEIIFETIDALEPKYGTLAGFQHNMLADVQWAVVFGELLAE